MASIHTLQPGRCYRVVQAFTDYDCREHPAGETWEFIGTTFAPYDDGLGLQVRLNGLPVNFRLQWLPEKQVAIIENFTSYVLPC